MRYDPVYLIHASADRNVQAFLRTLRVGEGTLGPNGYRTLFGGGLFESFADHPRVKVTRKLRKGGVLTSTAAGAYQFLERTWDGLVKQYGFRDFEPNTQDLGAIALILGRRALDDVIAGRIEAAVRKCNREWASLPESPYGQPTETMADFMENYRTFRSALDAPTGAPVEQESIPEVAAPEPVVLEPVPPPPNPYVKETQMAPFIAAALPAIIGAVPELVKIFGSGSEVSERNARAVEAVATIAKDAIGAKNEQELVEILASDPQAAVAVRDAVRSNWWQLEEVGGGIQAARETSIRMQGTHGLEANPAFLISMLLLVFPLMLLVDVFFVHPDNYSSDGLRTQIVTGVLMVISGLMGFWLGTSFTSSKKDDRIDTLISRK